MVKLRLLIIAIVLLTLAGAAVAQVPGTSEYEEGIVAPNGNTTWSVPLQPVFEAAAAKYKVPLPILLSLGYFGSAYENRGDAPNIDGGYGVMGLRKKDTAFGMGATSLTLASTLTGVSEDTLKTDPTANINGAAAVLDYYAKMWQVDRTKGVDAWLNVIITYAALDKPDPGDANPTPVFSRFFAMEIYEKLQKGIDSVNTSGEHVILPSQNIGSVNLQSLQPQGYGVSAGYSGATWYPAATCDYTASYCSKNTFVCHLTEGSAAGTLSWFRNCSSQVSAHYVVSESGSVWQCVDENYKAWHVGCANSYCIGVEHEGYTASSSHPTALYNASALLARDVCNRWGIPKQHNTCPPGILGHIDINNCVCGGSHTDPGGGWDWNYYIQQVGGTPPPPSYAASYNAQSYPATMTAGSTATAWVEYKNNGTATWGHAATNLGTQGPQDRSSPFFNSGNWISASRPTNVDQTAVTTGQIGRFTFILKAPSTPGTYTEQYKLVQEGVTWFGDTITWTITVTADKGNVTGTVRNSSNNQALSGATVSIAGVASDTTDANGAYQLAGVTPGTYTITASKAGFTTGTSSVTVSGGQTATKDFSLVSTDTTAPTAPSGLGATGASPSEIDLTWTASTDSGGSGLAGYIVYRAGVEIGRTTATTYADNGLAANTPYSYTVKAYDGASNVSAASNTASASTKIGTVAIFEDGFPNLTGWTADVVADNSTRGVTWDTTHSHNTFSGSGNAVTAVGGGPTPGTNGCWSYKSFPRPFAAGRYDGYFYDSSGNDSSRQGIHLRGYSGTTLAFSIYIGTYQPTSYSNYCVGVYALGQGGWLPWVTVAPRSAGWHKLSIEFLPYTGSNDMKFYVDDVLKYTTFRPSATNTYGISRTYLGHNYNVNQVGWYDDLAFYAQPPVPPTITAATAVNTTTINWNYTDASNNEAGFDLHDAAQTQKGTIGMNTNSITETGLVANTPYTRHIHAYNGTLNSLPSADTTRWTLSLAPTTSTVACSHTQGSSEFSFSAANGFGQGTVQYYTYAWDNSPTHSWSGSEAMWNSGSLNLIAGPSGSYYLHVKGYNGEGAANGTLDLGAYSFDGIPPTNPTSAVETHGAVDNTWQSTVSTPAFTWSGATDASGIAGYNVYFGTDETSTTGTYATSAAYSSSAVTSGTYYLRVQAKDNAGNFADEWATLFTFKYDSSAPADPTVFDDGQYSGSKSKIHASWFSSDADSDIAEYQYAVGTSAGATDVVNWTSAGTAMEQVIAIPDPGMQSSSTYFVSVKAKNGAGLWSGIASSDGITLAPAYDSIGAIKNVDAENPIVGLTGKVVTAVFASGFYIEESNRSSGIFVLGSGPSVGALVSVGGTLGVNGVGERAITDPVVTVDADPDLARVPGVLNISGAALGGSTYKTWTAGPDGGKGLNNVGLLVKVSGTVIEEQETYFTITDGSSATPTKIITADLDGLGLTAGEHITVTGISSLEIDGVLKPVIRLSAATDVKRLD